MNKIKKAIKQYIEAKNQLKKLRIVRTEGSVIGNYGEQIAAKKI